MSTGNRFRNRRTLGITLLIAVSFVLGFFARGSDTSAPSSAQSGLEQAMGSQETIWTCSMHPQVQLPEPGQCPICGMDLIPLENEPGNEGDSDRRLVMSKHARKLAEIRTVKVVRKEAVAEIHLVGKIVYDETRLSHVTAWVPGRLDRMFVDYVGVAIRKGDHMVDMYSPDLLTAQTELLEAIRAAESLRRSDLPSMRQTAEATVDAARERLRLWGLTSAQIQEIERRGSPTDHVTIYSPTSGTVVGKEVKEGMYVKTGTRIYTVADLTWVWVVLDAYESDISWLRFGQEVDFTVEAYPGETFSGRISFIEPTLNPKTRTVKVRVNVENPDLLLKPEMFVRGTVRARLASGGQVMDPELEGKWICPMHPEVVAERAGACPKCGMDLVTTASLGYLPVDETRLDLMVPASAVLRTGERAIVYIEVPDTEQPTFEGRIVTLGPRAGNEYVVREGLEEGDVVVANGNFKIDSALQILARPSMMSPDGGVPAPGHNHGGTEHRPGQEVSFSDVPESMPAAAPVAAPQHFIESLSPLYESYVDLQVALATDDLSDAKGAFESLRNATQAVPMQKLSGDGHMRWMEYANTLEDAALEGQGATSLDDARNAFRAVSNVTLSILASFGHSGEAPLYQFHCPMAFSSAGADWLQTGEDTRNPYFGSAMSSCGVLQKTTASSKSDHEDHNHESSKGGR